MEKKLRERIHRELSLPLQPPLISFEREGKIVPAYLFKPNEVYPLAEGTLSRKQRAEFFASLTIPFSGPVFWFGSGDGIFLRRALCRRGNKDTIFLYEPFFDRLKIGFPDFPWKGMDPARIIPTFDLDSTQSFLNLGAQLTRMNPEGKPAAIVIHPIYMRVLLEAPETLKKAQGCGAWDYFARYLMWINQYQDFLNRDVFVINFWKKTMELLTLALPGAYCLSEDKGLKRPASFSRCVSVVIVTFNQPEFLKKLLQSLQKFPDDLVKEIIVVDNGQEKPAEVIVKKFKKSPIPVILLKGRGNIGAIRGRNLGWRQTNTPWTVFMDDDIEIRSSAWLQTLWESATIHDSIGASGSFGVLYGSEKEGDLFQRVCVPGLVTPVAWLSAFCGLYRREALESVGGWNERDYEMIGYEDLEMSFAMRRKGWKLTVPGESLEPEFIFHRAAHTARASGKESEFRTKGKKTLFRRWKPSTRSVNLWSSDDIQKNFIGEE